MLLLQSSPDLTGYLIIGLAAFFIGIFITRSIFSIDKQLRNQQTQIRLLAKIAKHSGVPVEEIADILGISKPAMKRGVPDKDGMITP